MKFQKGQILGFIGANGAGKSTTIQNADRDFKRPHLAFVGLTARFPRIIAKIMSRILESFSDNAPQLWWDLALQETYTVLKEIYDVPDSLFHKRMDFLNEVLDLKEFIKGSCADSFS